MYGTNVGTLRVWVQPQGGALTKVWELSGNQGTGWSQATVNVGGNTNYQVNKNMGIPYLLQICGHLSYPQLILNSNESILRQDEVFKSMQWNSISIVICQILVKIVCTDLSVRLSRVTFHTVRVEFSFYHKISTTFLAFNCLKIETLESSSL